jgi:hypothetical protein
MVRLSAFRFRYFLLSFLSFVIARQVEQRNEVASLVYAGNPAGAKLARLPPGVCKPHFSMDHRHAK